MTDHQPDVAKFTATFCILLFNQLVPELENLPRRMQERQYQKPHKNPGNYICHLIFTCQADDIIAKGHQTSETGMHNKKKK